MFSAYLPCFMEEDWDDELPVWAVGQQKPFDSLLALQELLPLAEFLSSTGQPLTFNATKMGVEIDGDFRFESLQVEGFDSAYAKFIYHHNVIVSVAVCHLEFEIPQIILQPPDVLEEG
tara:strand:+ start:1460 stop:1813 length:354 start_codon:yes stop_codon:yes gene_type:complete